MKHILITGGTDGIGKVTAEKLIEAGHTVTILGKDEQKSQDTAAEFSCACVVADVTDYEQLQSAVEQAETMNGPIDILINNAGLWAAGPLVEATPDDIRRTLEVNTLGTMYATHVVVPGMIERKSGRIINTISQGGLYAKENRSVYTASKWAITGFTKALQPELREHGISVVGYYPGAMATGFFAKVGDLKDRSNALAPEVAANTLVYICSMPDDVEILEFGVQSINY